MPAKPPLKTRPWRLVLAALAGLASGCASVTSVTGTHYQSVSVQASDPGEGEVIGAVCELGNSGGKWYLTTPGSVMITRAYDTLQVTCRKEGLATGKASVVSAIRTAMYGNVALGGLIGAAVDHVDGAAYAYPDNIPVVMGSSTVIDASTQASPPENADSAATPAQVMKKFPYASYTLLPGGLLVADPPSTLKRNKPVAVTNVAAVAHFKKKREDVCDAHTAKGDYCWWSPPGNYNLCPLHLSYNACKASYGAGCQLGHGKVVPAC